MTARDPSEPRDWIDLRPGLRRRLGSRRRARTAETAGRDIIDLSAPGAGPGPMGRRLAHLSERLRHAGSALARGGRLARSRLYRPGEPGSALPPDEAQVSAPAEEKSGPVATDRRRRSWVPSAGLVVALALLLPPLAVAGLLAYCLATLPFGGGLVIEPTPSALVGEAANGQVFATRGVFKGNRLGPSEVPPVLAQAVVAIEDRRFYDHWGIDLRGLLRAASRNFAAGGTREGGSTITQQLVRMLYLSQDRTLKRKVQEAMLALWLEHNLSKEEILTRYLNTAYFGAGVYGADAAAKRYFGKSAGDLTLAEAAMLAGLVRAPSALAPNRNLDGARERADLVLDAMVETGAITEEQAEPARKTPASLRVPPETPPGTNYFVDMVTGDARRLIGSGPADLTVRTTLDLDLQSIAESIVARHLDKEGAARKVGQAALVALAPDGAIVAMVGGRDYAQSQFNRATQAKRQPGSLFKLFVYLTALRDGMTPQSTVVDRPVQIGDWEPENYGGRFRGPVTLRTAFANSINTVAAQLGEKVGIDAVIQTAHRLGVQSELPRVPSLALGSAEVTLLEMVRAFGAVAANAETLEPYGIRSILARDQTLYTRPQAPPPPASDPEARAGMLDLLSAVVREGTGKNARVNGPAAGKTGTTQDYRDAWFIGFTPDITVGVWVGNDDNSPTENVTGGDLPATIWREFVSQAARGRAKAAPVAAKKPVEQATLLVGPANANAAPKPPAPSVVRGVPRVVDTGTLRVQGQAVRLFGVEGVGGQPARELGRYIRGRETVCEPVGDAAAYRCRVNGRDLSEVILFNGGGRTTADASSDLVAAEEQARAAQTGLWNR